MSPKQGLFEFQISKRVQVGNPLCDHEMGFISLRIIRNRGWGNSVMDQFMLGIFKASAMTERHGEDSIYG